MSERCFNIEFWRDRNRLIGRSTIKIPVDERDGGFTLWISQAGERTPMIISGFIGKDEVSTTVSYNGAARLKRRTPRATP